MYNGEERGGGYVNLYFLIHVILCASLFPFTQAQRQKDAKELSAMRKLKDKTVSESQESVKQLKELKNSLQEVRLRITSYNS